MRIAFVGCGYAADFYAFTLKNHPQLILAGVFDKDKSRALNFARHYSVPIYDSLDDILADPNISLVVNLTNPASHYHITSSSLNAKKHVYSEKPLATSFTEAEDLVKLANKNNLLLSSAPVTLLGTAAQAVWRLLKDAAIGKVWLAYAELDSGAVHQMNYLSWRSKSGISWPFEDEFETGNTLEHAAYQLTWLTAFFGPAREVTAFSSCLVPDKIPSSATVRLGDDFSLACIKFASGVIARLTCSTLAPEDYSLKIVGSEGVITVENCWRFDSPIYIQKRLTDYTGKSNTYYLSERQRIIPKEEHRIKYQDSHDIDFSKGVADLADAVASNRAPRLPAEHALHVLEIIFKIIGSDTFTQEIKTTFPELMPGNDSNLAE